MDNGASHQKRETVVGKEAEKKCSGAHDCYVFPFLAMQWSRRMTEPPCWEEIAMYPSVDWRTPQRTLLLFLRAATRAQDQEEEETHNAGLCEGALRGRFVVIIVSVGLLSEAMETGLAEKEEAAV